MKTILLMLSIIFLFQSNLQAFDGNRKGFVLGGGIGIAYKEKTSNKLIDDNRQGFVTNFVIGYSFDKKNQLLYEATLIYSKSGNFSKINGSNNIRFSHYFHENEKTFFTTCGLTQYLSNEEQKIGAITGIGYQFKSHLQVGLYYRSEFDISKYKDIKVLISYIGY